MIWLTKKMSSKPVPYRRGSRNRQYTGLKSIGGLFKHPPVLIDLIGGIPIFSPERTFG